MSQHIHKNDARFTTRNSAGRDQLNQYFTFSQPESGPSDQLPQSPQQSPPSFNDAPLDFLSPHFKGREKELDSIEKVFATVHGCTPTRFCLYAMHGMGKTQLALKYAAQSHNSRIFWISGATIEKVNQGLANVLALVRHPDRDHPDHTRRLTSARRWLEESNEDDPNNWLLIIDNVDREVANFLKEHLPRTNAHGNILMTTRTADVAEFLISAAGYQHQSLELRAPDLKDATELLLMEAGIDITSSTTAEDLVKCVGRLPLAISHAASFIKQSYMSPKDLLCLYRSKDRYEVISWENDLSPYERKSVALTFGTQLDELRLRHPEVSGLLKVLSFFDSEKIPRDILIQGAEALQSQPTLNVRPSCFGPLDGQANSASTVTSKLIALIHSPMKFHGAIQQLRSLSLVGYESNMDTSILRIHDLVRIMIQESARRDDIHWFHVAVQLVCGAFLRIDDHSSFHCWAQCEAFTPHIQSLAKWDEQHAIGIYELVRAKNGIARYMASQGRWGEAEPLHRQVLEDTEKLLGPEHKDTLEVMHCLAMVCQNIEAESLYKRVLVGKEKEYGPEHPSTLWTLNNLAVIYVREGRYGDAEAICGRVLATREKNLGLENSDTLWSVSNLAMVYNCQGRLSEAEKLYKRALKGKEDSRSLGPKHPSTLWTLHELAVVYESQGRYNEAEVLCGQVLAAREEVLGHDHLDTLRSVNKLAMVHNSLGRFSEAEKLCERARAGEEKLLGSQHPTTLWTLDDLATIYESQGRYSEAVTLCKRVLADREKLLGLEHPDTLWSVNNLAMMYNSQGRFSEAETLCQRALVGKEKLFGSQHQSTLWTLHNLAVVCRRRGRYKEAETLCERALAAREKVHGHEHVNTLCSIDSLAMVYKLQGRFNEAETLCKRALEGRKKQLGLHHPGTLSTMLNLAIIYDSQRRFSEAETLCGQSLEATQRLLGSEHPDTLRARNHLATVNESQGQLNKALVLYSEVLAGREKKLGADHPDTLQTVTNLAGVYHKQGKCSEAQLLYTWVLKAGDKVLGPEHAETLATVRNIFFFYLSQSQFRRPPTQADLD